MSYGRSEKPCNTYREWANNGVLCGNCAWEKGFHKGNIPKISAINRVWDKEEKHMLSVIDEYFKSGAMEIEIAICNNKTGEEIVSGIVKPEKFYKSDSYLKHFKTNP